MAEIAASAGDQATGLQSVNAGITEMGKVTQQNNVRVEQSTAASYQFADEARELSN